MLRVGFSRAPVLRALAPGGKGAIQVPPGAPTSTARLAHVTG